jgi:hypothetical protein
VLVVVVPVNGMTVAVVHVVDVTSVRYRDVAAILTMLMVMPIVGGVFALLALVVVPLVVPVQVAIMRIVDVTTVRDSNVAAAVAMRVVVADVFGVSGCHHCPFWRVSQRSSVWLIMHPARWAMTPLAFVRHHVLATQVPSRAHRWDRGPTRLFLGVEASAHFHAIAA